MPRLEDDLAASFRQDTHLAQLYPDASPEALVFGNSSSVGGVCYALSAMWVLRHLSHRAEGPAGRAAYLAQDSTLLAAVEAHRLASLGCRQNLPCQTLAEHHRALALGAHGLGWTGLALGEISRAGRSLEVQAARLHASLSSSHHYHFVTFHGAYPALGHAVATYTAGGAAHGLPLLYLFDPNWGEFKVSARHAPDFIARLLAWYDGHGQFGRITHVSVLRVARAQ